MTGVVLDMEGVLHVDWEPIAGAAAAVAELEGRGHRCVVLTNTTTKTRAEIAAALGEIGFDFAAGRIVSAASATGDYLRRRFPSARVLALAEPGALCELDGVDLRDVDDVDVVLIGGPDETFDYARLGLAFRALHGGAVLVAMHENRWWVTRSGPALDAGAFVRGLAYAAGVRPRIVGKPRAGIFHAACGLLDLAAADCVMVGDDLRSDVLPARRAGLRGVLVRTGKGATCERSDARVGEVDAVLDSVADLAGWLAG